MGTWHGGYCWLWPLRRQVVHSFASEICRNIILPEQRTIDYRDPSQLPPARIPPSLPPRTVSAPRPQTPEWQLSLDEAIRIALENTQVVRMLCRDHGGSQRPDHLRRRDHEHDHRPSPGTLRPGRNRSATWSRTNTPFGELNPLDPTQSFITSTPTDAFNEHPWADQDQCARRPVVADWTENPMRIAESGPLLFNPQIPTTHSPVRSQSAQPGEPNIRAAQLHAAAPPGGWFPRQHGADRDRPAQHRAVVLPVQGQRAGAGPWRD